MTQDILSRFVNPFAPESTSDPAILRVMLLSTPIEVRNAILELYQRGFAEVKHWSPFQPIPNSNEVISIYTRRGRR